VRPTASRAPGQGLQRIVLHPWDGPLPRAARSVGPLQGWQLQGPAFAALAAALLVLAVPAPWLELSAGEAGRAGRPASMLNDLSMSPVAASAQDAPAAMSTWHGGTGAGVSGSPVRSVALELDGRVVWLRSDAPTLREALRRAGVRLAPGDRVLLGHALLPLEQPLSQALSRAGTAPVSSGVRTASQRGGPRLAPRVVHADGPDASTSEALRLVLVRAVPLEIIDEGVRLALHTTARTVGAALSEAGITLEAEDQVVPPPETPVVAGLRVLINRAQSLLLIHDGQERAVRTRAASVADLLAAEGIALGPLDRVEPALDADVRGYTRVRVVRGWETVEELLEQLPCGEAWQHDPALPVGEVREVRAGRNGTVRLVVRRFFEDGQEVESRVVSEQVLEPPRDRILAFGTRVPEGQPHIDGLPALGRVRAVLTMLATAYDPGPRSTGKRPGSPDYGVTASGLPAGYGVVAVDPRVIPLGTRLYIPGYGFAIAGDTGGAIVGQRIDVGFATEQEALNFGRRMVDVYILE
jgi:uncharacterized protein YabE (DUF348 family)/3D (Asp-Asp-Asp) domain-containing protein